MIKINYHGSGSSHNKINMLRSLTNLGGTRSLLDAKIFGLYGIGPIFQAVIISKKIMLENI